MRLRASEWRAYHKEDTSCDHKLHHEDIVKRVFEGCGSKPFFDCAHERDDVVSVSRGFFHIVRVAHMALQTSLHVWFAQQLDTTRALAIVERGEPQHDLFIHENGAFLLHEPLRNPKENVFNPRKKHVCAPSEQKKRCTLL